VITHAERLGFAVAKDVKLRMRTGGMLMVAEGVPLRHIRVLQLRTWTDGPENETGSCNLRNAMLVRVCVRAIALNLRNAILLRKCMRAIVLDKALLETRTRFGAKSVGIETLPTKLLFAAVYMLFPRSALESLADTRVEATICLVKRCRQAIFALVGSARHRHDILGAVDLLGRKLSVLIGVDFLDDVMPIVCRPAGLRRRSHELLEIIEALKMPGSFSFRQWPT